MTQKTLNAMRDAIQSDPGGRGLRADPATNLINACADDFAAACRSIADHPKPAVAILTGFYIPDANPPVGETDGPLGALFLARSLTALGIPAVILTDAFCRQALAAGLVASGLRQSVPLLILPAIPEHWDQFLDAGWLPFARDRFHLTHFISIERPGPSHTADSFQKQLGSGSAPGEQYLQFLRELPPESQNRCFTASGKDITNHVSPAHLLFEAAKNTIAGVTTIGIGDGGNEVGMGKIPWDTIRRNIPGGGMIACRVPADFLIVCGVSNWGAYAMAAGVHLLRGVPWPADLRSEARERQLLQIMVEQGPLVDGVAKFPSVSVDGLSFERYMEPFRQLVELCGQEHATP